MIQEKVGRRHSRLKCMMLSLQWRLRLCNLLKLIFCFLNVNVAKNKKIQALKEDAKYLFESEERNGRVGKDRQGDGGW